MNLKNLTLAAACGLCAAPALAHDMMYVGQNSQGRLTIFIEDGILPNMMYQSTFSEIDGWVQTEFGLETVNAPTPELDLFPINASSDIQLILLAADEGMQVLKDGFEGPLAIGEAYPLHHPFFHVHPLWNIHIVEIGRVYSMTFVLHDVTGQYPDSAPFTLTFGAVPCPADFDWSTFVDLDDYTLFVEAFEAGTDDADFDLSGFVDIEDFTGFVIAFEAGC
ncbi:MAG: hypothetical protein IT435_19730 [Phycisphaerales bacterium]|nr:hypothetical protein [Phycisphaerales bacterium]